MPLDPRPHFKSVPPYVMAESDLPGDEPVISLVSNESGFPPSPKAMAAMQNASGDSLRLYPPGGLPRLRAALAAKYGLDDTRIVFGNGSGELINLLCRSFLEAGREGIMSANGYPYFKTAIENCGAVAVRVPEIDLRPDLDGILAAVNKRSRIVFLANPNNPTGYYTPMAEVRAFQQRLPDHVLLVLDEAYAEYLPDETDNDSGFALADGTQNVAVLRTFSKIYALAGLRIGWFYGPPLVGGLLNQQREASNTSAAAEDVALAALLDETYFNEVKAGTLALRAWFAGELEALGMTVHPSETNFLLTTVPGGQAAALYSYLRDRRILVRPQAPYGLPDCLRYSIGTRAELETVVAALRACPLLEKFERPE